VAFKLTVNKRNEHIIFVILQMVESYASNVMSVEDLGTLLNMLFNGTADLSGLNTICASREQQLMMLEMLKNLTSSVTIGLGLPVCRDNRILDDLVAWGIEQYEEMLNANSTIDVCL